MSSRRLALFSALAVAAVVFGALLLSEPAPDPIRPGQPAPPFELPLLDGGSISLASLRGRVVLLNFWATWCAPCEAEMPAMQRLHAGLAAGGDFELVAVSVDAGREEVALFQQRLGLTFPIALDPAKRVSTEYQSYRFPESYLIDRDGRILSRYIGPRDWDSSVYVDRIRRVMDGAGAEAVRE